MATYTKFEELPIWSEARAFRKELSPVILSMSANKDFSIMDQLKRAALSVMTNIAEGFERGSTREFIQFLVIAKASLGEVRSLLYAAEDDNIITTEINQKYQQSALQLSSKLMGFINYLRASNFKSRQKPTTIN
jgi:four helix bundle protein